MTAYNKSPFGPPPTLMVGGRTEWVYGNQSDTVSPTQIAVSSVALASNVATVVGTIVSGNAPAVGSLVSIQGTQSDSGIFNVTNVALTGATTNALTGVTTITFALTGANFAAASDSGFALVPAPITYEAITNGASRQLASAENDPSMDDERSYFVQVFFGTLPTACVVSLQASLVDQDSAYTTVGTVATVASSTLTINNTSFPNLNLKFLRLAVSGLSGSGTIAAAVMG